MDAEERKDRRSYQIGLVLALVLSAIPFGLLASGMLPRASLLWVIGVTAAVQVIVHFRFFLHIDLSRSHRHDLQLILFSALIVLMMVGGTLWVMFNERMQMG